MPLFDKDILDVCCGGRMFYFDKKDERVHFCDNREVDTYLCDGRHFVIKPDQVCDFTNLPFEDNSKSLIIFDPPHLTTKTSGWQKIKYGWLDVNWKETISKGFAECFRVLRPKGTLLFKWSEESIKIKEVLTLTQMKPIADLLGGRNGRTYCIVFFKDC